MTERKIEILWTKQGDGTPHQRKRTLTVRLPVELRVETLGATNMTLELVDAVLSLPPNPRSSNADRVRLPDPLDALTDEVVLETAIPQLRWEIERWVHAKAEEEEALRAERRAKLEAWIDNGDPDTTPWGVDKKRVGEVRSVRHPSYSRDVMHRSLSDEALGWLEDHDFLRARVETHLELLNSNAGQRVRTGLDAADDKRDETRAEQEARDAAKQAVDDARAAEIRVWTAEHGSARLQAQIAQGLPGWPLYLHERLQSKFGDAAELDNDGETGDALVNPTKDQLGLARQVAILVVERGQAADKKEAFERIEIVPIKVITEEDRDEEGYGYDPDDPSFTKVYVTFSGYRSGTEVFAMKTIRFVCEES